MRKVINGWAAEKGEWAGAPLPISHAKLVIEPRYPFQLNGKQFEDSDRDQAREDASRLSNWQRCERAFGEDWREDSRFFLINGWYSRAKNQEVLVYHTGDGRSKVALLEAREPAIDRLDTAVKTLGAVADRAWDFGAEFRAQRNLAELINAHALRCYLLTGMFLETSPRTHLTYLFRRCRPTLAVRQDFDSRLRFLAALCLHPIGYYEGTYAGVMVPTDDVIAHLLLMRGDEHKFWAKSNQHSADQVEAGI